jgi:hypothetical protein
MCQAKTHKIEILTNEIGWQIKNKNLSQNLLLSHESKKQR